MALAAGLDLDAVADALGDAVPASRWRMELTERADGLVVLNDAYNANPESMRAALDTLARHRRPAADDVRSRCSARCSSSATGAAAAHTGVGAYAAAAGVDLLVTVGDRPRPRSRGASRRPARRVWPSPRRGVTRRSTGCGTMSRLLMSSW